MTVTVTVTVTVVRGLGLQGQEGREVDRRVELWRTGRSERRWTVREGR